MRLIHSLVAMRGVFPQTRLSTGVVDNYCGQVGKKCAMVQKKTPTLWQAGVFSLMVEVTVHGHNPYLYIIKKNKPLPRAGASEKQTLVKNLLTLESTEDSSTCCPFY